MRRSLQARKRLQDSYSATIDACLLSKFEVEFNTHWNIFSMQYITTRIDEENLTQEMVSFIDGFDAAWHAAQDIV